MQCCFLWKNGRQPFSPLQLSFLAFGHERKVEASKHYLKLVGLKNEKHNQFLEDYEEERKMNYSYVQMYGTHSAINIQQLSRICHKDLKVVI